MISSIKAKERVKLNSNALRFYCVFFIEVMPSSIILPDTTLLILSPIYFLEFIIIINKEERIFLIKDNKYINLI